MSYCQGYFWKGPSTKRPLNFLKFYKVSVQESAVLEYFSMKFPQKGRWMDVVHCTTSNIASKDIFSYYCLEFDQIWAEMVLIWPSLNL